MEPQIDPLNELLVLNGGVTIDIEVITEGSSPGKDSVKVRQLPIRLLQRMAELQGDESALVELYCDKPEGWADKLTIESHERLIALGDRLNEDPFDRWLKRRQKALVKLAEEAAKTQKTVQALASSARTSP